VGLVWLSLEVGISIDRLSLGSYSVEKLYIKLNKKLIVEAKEVVIPQMKSEPSLVRVDRLFDRIQDILSYFEYISLGSVQFKNHHFEIIYTDNVLYVNSDLYEVAGTIMRTKEEIRANIRLLSLKKQSLYFMGEVKYDIKDEGILLNGTVQGYGIEGEIEAQKEGRFVRVDLKSQRFDNLRPLINSLSLKPSVKAWIVDKIEAKHYRLHGLHIEGEIDEKKGFVLDKEHLHGEVAFEEVKIFYKEGLEPIVAEGFLLEYRQGGLYFKLKHPTYNTRSLEGSTISITPLDGKGSPVLYLNLEIESKIDSVVEKILKAYKLNIPVKKGGETTHLSIDIALALTQKKKIDVSVDLTLKRGTLSIEGVEIPVERGKIFYEKGRVKLQNILIKDQWYQGVLNGTIFLKKSLASLVLRLKKLEIGKRNAPLLRLKNRTLKVTLSYANGLKVTIPSLGVTLQRQTKETTIVLASLKKVLPYLVNQQLKLEGGRMKLWTKDFQRYRFEGSLVRKECFFYAKEGRCYTHVPFRGSIGKKGVNLDAFQGAFHYTQKPQKLLLKGINIDLKRLLQTPLLKATTKEKSKGSGLRIEGYKSQWRYGLYALKSDHYTINVTPEGSIDAVGYLGKSRIDFHQKGSYVKIDAKEIGEKMLQPLIHFKGLKGGVYSMHHEGNIHKQMRGEITIKGGVVKDFKVYNNLLALINTLPALASLHTPGFSKEGFKIKKGRIVYHMVGEKIFFDSFSLEGGSATIVGKGWVALKSQTLSLSLAIQTAREIGGVVGSVPLLGYILMGKDKSMTVGVEVTGTLSNPKLKTSVAKELLLLPLEILKRTLTSPAHIINQ